MDKKNILNHHGAARGLTGDGSGRRPGRRSGGGGAGDCGGGKDTKAPPRKAAVAAPRGSVPRGVRARARPQPRTTPRRA